MTARSRREELSHVHPSLSTYNEISAESHVQGLDEGNKSMQRGSEDAMYTETTPIRGKRTGNRVENEIPESTRTTQWEDVQLMRGALISILTQASLCGTHGAICFLPGTTMNTSNPCMEC